MRIIVTGAKGLIGKEVSNYLKIKHDVFEADILLGHDLTDEDYVRAYFKQTKAHSLVNLFALNDHVDSKSRKVGIFDVRLYSLANYFSVNLVALFSVCREFARNNRKGSIVNFSSHYGIVAPQHQKHIGYSISKAGVIMLTKHLAVELAPDIRVNCIAPGGLFHKQPKAFVTEYAKKTPMGRMMMPGELNKAVEFLCSDDSSYVTGTVISVDGGWTAW